MIFVRPGVLARWHPCVLKSEGPERALLAVQRCSTSYVRLPLDYPKLLSKHRPQDLHIIWNDTWVSVTSGSEDYSFKVQLFF